ncbi:MAG: hypothetical protein ACI87E_005169, partial [Mariniblastus sp.]
MSHLNRRIVLLGPQPKYHSLQSVFLRPELQGTVGLITAGWETDEQEDQSLKQAIAGPTVNLKLFARTEQLFAEDSELIETLRARQDELRLLRVAYNDRLTHLLRAARQIIRREEHVIDLGPERESAIEMVRQLDRQYFVRTSQIVDHYESILKTADRPLVARYRREIQEILKQIDVLAISGGHVAIILNRLKIFGILDVEPELPIVAWSAGAMALADQVVLYHDSPPQGAGNPEVLRAGMGLFQDLLPLPNGKTRLNLADQARVELFARRFDRFKCVVLDDQTILERHRGQWTATGLGETDCLGCHGS